MRKLSKTLLSLLLIAAMLASFVVLPAAAEEPAAEQPTEAVQAAETQATDSSFMKIFHLDCGRKYFTKDWILALINEISAAGYTHLQLAIGNDGMRFLLDDMSLTVGDKTYSSEDVAAAIHAGNVAYDNRQSYTPEKDELTESEMNAIISYATSKGITVIPLINNPGHMDAILSAATSLTGTSCSYNRSVTTIDLGNEDAVAFTKAFLTKYVEYFAAKGCTHFGIGADEYANDVYSTGSMGFGQLVRDGNYGKFISYVNSVAALVKAAEMKPVAFNDGFYFNNNTYSGTFDTDIVISFWTSGWGGYQSETASQLAARGHQMINTNGDFYYVLGKSDKFDSGYDYASNFSNTAFMGSTVSNPAGATFCVWCDYPGAETEQEIAQKIRLPLRAMAQRMKGESVVLDENELVSGGFKADGTINAATVSDEATGVSVTASGLTGITVAAVDKGTELDGKKVAGAWNIELTTENGSYTGSAAVKVPLDGNWTGCTITAGVMNENGGIDYGKDYDIKDGFLTFTAPHFSTVVVLAEPQQKSLVVPTNGTKTVEENGNLTGYTPEYSKDGIVKLEMSFANDVTTMTFTGLANGDVSVTVGNLVYQITVTDKTYSSEKTITVAVGGTYELPLAGNGKNGTSTVLDDTYATVEVKHEYQEAKETLTKNDSLSGVTKVYISNDGKNFLSVSGNSLSNETTFADATEWTVEEYNNNEEYYLKSSNGYYLIASRTWYFGVYYYSLELINSTKPGGSDSNYRWKYTSNGFNNSSYNSYYIIHSSSETSGWDLSRSDSSTRGYAYTLVPTEEVNKTTITFTGKSEGSTQVEIDGVLYNINVVAVPTGAMTNTSLTLEYWITNSPVYEKASVLSNKTKSITTATDGVSTDAGVDITQLAPNHAYSNFNGWKDVYYWQAMRLDSNHLQTEKSGVDQTADGTTFTHVRYHAGAWQYKTLDGTWHYFLSTDQAVAYYLQKTKVTTEVETYVKDWGYGTNGTTPDTSSHKGQVALTVAVVYPDGTVSPAEKNMYSKSTTIFNYWDGRDIGIIAPKNNEDYTISKITVTDGTRDKNTDNNVWYISDTITWEKTTLDDGVTKWYNEREVWNKSSGTTPMVNGKNSKETWSAKNTAKLVLIYLEAAKKESNLNVVYYDDTYSKEIISSQIVMSYTQGQELPTYLNSLQNNGTVTPGTITLADDAYVTNSSGVDQTFNKNVATVPGVAAQYRSGLYKYDSAEISEDGKTLTLHYKISANNLKKYYVVDFGLPVQFELTDLVDDTNLSKVRISTVTGGNVTYDETTKTFTYTPTEVLKSLATASIAISYTGKEEAILTVGFIPASTVYYEEGFASYSANWVSEGTAHGARQAKESYSQATNNYGFDPAYGENSANSEGTVARTTTVGSDATFKFNGTGLELYLRTKNTSVNAEDVTNHSYMLVQVYEGSEATTDHLKRMSFVDVNNLFVAKDTGYGYNTPCWTVNDMALNDYTVVVRFVKGQELAIDGFRVTGTQGDRYKNAYAADGEANMQTAEIRNMVLAQANVYALADNWYKVGSEVIDAVFDKEDAARISGAVLIKKNYNESTGGTEVTVDKDLVNIGPKNEIYLKQGEAVVMQLTGSYASVQVGMRSLTGDAVTYKINTEEKTMNSTVDMYYKVEPVEGKLVIQNVSEDGILALTKLKVTGAGTTTNDVSVETTPEAIRYAMALMRGIDVPQFTDVAEDAWYHDYVYDLVYRGVVNGMTATTYEPEGKLTRAQFVKLLACSLEEAETLKTYEGQHPFTDSEGHWAEAYIAWAKDKGIVEGVSATEFDPEAPITREQMATIFGRYALKQGIELPKSDNAAGSFPDADKISEYAREFVELMRIAGILNGYEDGTFRPQGNATRAEAAKLFSLFLSITDKLAK